MEVWKMKVVIKSKFNMPYTQFDNPFVESRLTEEWIDYRLKVFMKYTYKGLINQTNQNFKAFIEYDPLSEEIIRRKLAAYGPLSPNVEFVTDFNRSLEAYIKDTDYVGILYLDSDNMLHSSFIEQIYRQPVEKLQVILAPSGYVYEEATGKVGLYAHPYPDTFYVLIYKVQDYLNGYRHPYPCNQYGDVSYGNHFLRCRFTYLQGQAYIVTIHKKNITHELDRMLLMGTVRYILTDQEEIRGILQTFGVQ